MRRYTDSVFVCAPAPVAAFWPLVVARVAPNSPRSNPLVLARPNRVTRPSDFKAIVRRGRRFTSDAMVVYVLPTENADSRFGFIVTKAVGGAVVRNVVRRRLRAICSELLATSSGGSDVVVRALPASVEASWATLHSEIARGLGTMARR